MGDAACARSPATGISSWPPSQRLGHLAVLAVLCRGANNSVFPCACSPSWGGEQSGSVFVFQPKLLTRVLAVLLSATFFCIFVLFVSDFAV